MSTRTTIDAVRDMTENALQVVEHYRGDIAQDVLIFNDIITANSNARMIHAYRKCGTSLLEISERPALGLILEAVLETNTHFQYWDGSHWHPLPIEIVSTVVAEVLAADRRSSAEFDATIGSIMSDVCPSD